MSVFMFYTFLYGNPWHVYWSEQDPVVDPHSLQIPKSMGTYNEYPCVFDYLRVNQQDKVHCNNKVT